MNQMEFLNYLPTPKEKYLGIATVKLYGKIILRFKIVPTKDGNGYFPCAASYKVTDEQGDRYVPALMLDSNSENEELMNLIKFNVKRSSSNGSNSALNASSSSKHTSISVGVASGNKDCNTGDCMNDFGNPPF